MGSLKMEIEGEWSWHTAVNNAAHTRCADEYGMQCVQYTVTGTTVAGNMEARMDFGECLSSWETASCGPYTDSEGTTNFINVDNCETNVCSSSYCNDFGNEIEGMDVHLPQCREISYDNELGAFDFRIFPDCSATEVYHGIENCVMQFGNQFNNFDNSDQCRSEADRMVECMGQLVQKCLSTSCPTMLDAIPGLRSEYHVIRFFASQVDSMDDLINTIFMIIPFSSEQERDAIRRMIPDPTQFLCMDDNNMDQIGDMLTDAFGQLMQLVGGSLDLNDIMGEQLADQFFCSNDILPQVMQPAMTMLPQLINSNSESDVCNTFVDFANNMIGQIFTHCDFTRVDDFIAPFMPPDFPVEIFSVIEGFVPMLQGLSIPACPGPYNPCDYNPCMDQGVCQHSGDGSYTCYCFDGSQGQMCPGGMDPCDSYPCMGQGSCVSNGQSYYCTGGMDPCDSNPCYGQGSCISNGQSYYCSGSGMDPCDSNPCYGQG